MPAENDRHMKLLLLVSNPCPECQRAELVWASIAAAHGLPFQVLDIGDKAGADLRNRLDLHTVPAIVIDGVLKGIGVQSPTEAERLIKQPPKSPT